MMIHSVCSSYHWTYEEAMKRTLPQIIMLNHAASVVGERMSRRYKMASSGEEPEEDDDPPVWRGKRLSEMTTEETLRYMDGFFD